MSYYGGVHTQIGVYRRRNDSRHAIDLHAMSWIVTASLAWLAAEGHLVSILSSGLSFPKNSEQR